MGNGKWGLIDKKGNYIIKPISDSILRFSENLAIYVINDKEGFIDINGNVVIEPKYDGTTMFKSGLAAVRVNGLDGYINTSGEFVLKPQFENANIFDENGIALVEYGGEKGFIDKNENWKIKLKPDQYCSLVSEFHESLSLIRIPNWNYGFINKKGKQIYEQEESDKIPRHFSEGLAQIEKDEKWGYIDKTGKIAIEPQFDFASDFKEGFARIKSNKSWGYIDKSGSVVIEPKFNSVGNFSEGLAWVSLGGLNGGGYIDKTGEFKIGPKIKDPKILSAVDDPIKAEKRKCKKNKERKICKRVDHYDRGTEFSEGLAAVCIRGRCGYIDKTGDKVIDFKFSRALKFFEGLARVTTDEKWGYIDKTGEIVIEEKFDFVREFNSGVAMVDTGDEGKKYGFINQKGEWILEPQKHASLGFSEGLMFHFIGNPYLNPRYGYMDQTGEYVIEPKYKLAAQFSEGLACVETWGKQGYINTKGQWIWKPTR